MLEGCLNLTVDAKGRIAIPAQFRPETGKEIVLTAHYASSCLLLFPVKVWENTLIKIQALPSEADAIKRHLIGNANRLELDEQNRIVVPQRLRKFARFEKSAIIRGQMTHCEIWDETTLDEEEMQSMQIARRQIEENGVPRGMENFSF